MLTFDVKRKINTLRDILVGKVPDPKAQVEQITIALIYKFMDDMDIEGLEFGGTRQFFTGEYEKYAWTEIMKPENSGQQRALLYAEGIEKMTTNPNLPQLFRDIFRGAYIPYRDPDTLNMFLKEVSDFSYDNSEDLGNAFEYLLSIMGSQGDAGQFRTPRHIIDMMVEIVDPKKNETILDPACGTAGFLISAYRHILAQNKDEDGKSTLTADDRKRLTENFAGYDISPDMVRLSRVNMYLHHFTKPKISEYDTLTSEEKWDDCYDVILANPPFMTPKGGIMPHSRYRVKAKRSEVLFVDYIAEHLNPNGRAAIIVPEGIIFQSSNAYKELRKYLVNNVDLIEQNNAFLLHRGDLLVARTGATYGKTLYFDTDETAVFASFLIKLDLPEYIDHYFYWIFAQTQNYWDQANRLVSGGAQPQFNANAIKQLVIPIPPLDVQKSIVKQAREEQKIIDANKKLISIFKQKITDKISEVWGE